MRQFAKEKESKSMENLKEEELILRAQSGDDEAMNKLLSHYKTLVLSVTRKYFLINNEPSDLVQEGMIGLFNAIRSFDKSSHVSFYSYARLCIKRQVQSAVISNNRLKNQMLNTYFSINNQGKILLTESRGDEKLNDEDNGFYLESKGFTPEENVVFKEKLEETEDKIEKTLSTYEKEVLRLYMSGLNYTQIAIKLKKDAKSIDNALSRIKIKLKFLKGE